MMKKVSIVIPTFNQGSYLPACVDHCLFQTYPNLELIIVDGGSTDDTKYFLSHLMKKVKKSIVDPVDYMDVKGKIIRRKELVYPQNRQIKILTFNSDIGPTRTYNEGFKEVTGSYCTYVVGDDLPHPHMIEELVDALDNYIPEPQRAVDKPFLMPIEDVFSIEGRGTVVTGRVERGVVKVNDEVEIVGMGKNNKTVVTGIEMFQKTLDEGRAGDNVGLLLRGIKKEDVERGQVIAVPGSVTPHTEFEAEIYVLSKEEGGRHTPFFSGYKPQFYIRTTDVTGELTLPEGTEMVMPGDTFNGTVKLIVPVALEEQQRFAIREGGSTVGAGVVTKILK